MGLAAVDLAVPATPRLLVVLGHGAGGGPDSPDLAALASALPLAGYAVARVVQPYRLAGRRAPAPAAQLDAAYAAVVEAVRGTADLRGLPVVVGGRSSGARVACRTARALGAVGVLALAFPLHPRGRPERSRLAELLAAGVPTLVVQGERDAFGHPDEFPSTVDVDSVAGDHALRADPAAVVAAALAFVRRVAPTG